MNDSTESFDYSPHELRLSLREWMAVLFVVLLFAICAPRIWSMFESVEWDQDYRVPYELSSDYWLYEKHLESIELENSIFVIGDSVIWGEYVRPDGTLSHYLNVGDAGSGRGRFVNAGVNGLFPLALEGLVWDHAEAVEGAHVLLHANALWMTSPEADLSLEKEHKFNHESLVPQFGVRIPCYRADSEKRLGYWFDRKVTLFAWTHHLENAYFDHLNLLEWTLEEGNDRRNPLSSLTLAVPGEPVDDPARGESSGRHRSWEGSGMKPQNFAWVDLDKSLQWAAFQRLVELLNSRDNELLVVIGPFNEHMIAPEARDGFEKAMKGMETWFTKSGIRFVVPRLLPSELYGDSSHPLTEGYRQLAKELGESEEFQSWSGVK